MMRHHIWGLGSCGTGRNRPGARVGYRHIQTPEILPWDPQEQDWYSPSSGLRALARVALCPRPLPHQRWLNKELVARLSFLSPHKIMPTRTWNSSWCKWGISRNLLLPMMYLTPSKVCIAFVTLINWIRSPKRFLGMCFFTFELIEDQDLDCAHPSQ